VCDAGEEDNKVIAHDYMYIIIIKYNLRHAEEEEIYLHEQKLHTKRIGWERDVNRLGYDNLEYILQTIYISPPTKNFVITTLTK